MKRLFLFLITLLAVLCNQAANVARPKLVVGIVVDQMRWDYLYYYYQDYSENGLRRLIDGGYSFANTQINYAPTVTAIGHSSVYTGSVPAIHGIAGNYFWLNDKGTYCCEDKGVKSVGSNSKEGQMSPHLMLTSTIGDQLRISTDFASRVFGVALKDRAAILPAGHSANAAYWWDTSAGHFVSSTYYMQQLPDWVEDFNKKNRTKPGFNIKTSTEGVTKTFEMAKALLENEQLGQQGTTDMLAVSISSTDAIGHKYSTRGKENKAVYMQLDKDLADFLNTLDAKVGKGNYLVFLTADHGAAHNFNYLRNHKIPAGGWDWEKSTQGMNQHLQSKFGIAPVLGEDNYQFFFDDAAINKAGIKKQEVIDEAIDWLQKDSLILYAFDYNKLSETTMPQWLKERLTNGYFRNRSGEVGFVTLPQFFGQKDTPTYAGTSHGQPFNYDTHIPFVLYGWNIPTGENTKEVHIVDIAPTICAMLHIQAPNGCIGKPQQIK